MNGPWRLQYNAGSRWLDVGSPDERLDLAIDSLRLLSRTSRASWRVVDRLGKRIVEFQSGARGDA